MDQYHQKWIAFSPRRDVGGTVVVNQTDDVLAQLHHHRLQLLFLEGHPVVSFLALGPADPVLFVDPATFRGRAAAAAAIVVVVAGHVPGGTRECVTWPKGQERVTARGRCARVDRRGARCVMNGGDCPCDTPMTTTTLLPFRAGRRDDGGGEPLYTRRNHRQRTLLNR